MQIEIQIPKAVLFDVKYTVEQATNFAKKEVALGFYMQKWVSVALCSQIACFGDQTGFTCGRPGTFDPRKKGSRQKAVARCTGGYDAANGGRSKKANCVYQSRRRP